MLLAKFSLMRWLACTNFDSSDPGTVSMQVLIGLKIFNVLMQSCTSQKTLSGTAKATCCL